MDTFNWLPNNANAFLTSIPQLPQSDSVGTLVLGLVIGFVVAFLYGPLTTGSSALYQSLLAVTHRLLDTVTPYRGLDQERCRDALLAAATWKTYKKVSPWRRVAVEPNSTTGRPSFSKTEPHWYGSERDIDFFLSRVGDLDPSQRWRCICQNSLGDYLKYEAYIRALPGNKTEYKSVTYVKNATAEEMTDFYLDDECRSRWDSMLAVTEQLEAGSAQDRCEVVRWIRSFPFPFLTDREYVIGRRIFRKDNTIYTISRGIEHAAAPVQSSLVRMDVFYSMWSCRDIVCPWGSDQTACEVVLLHHEQFKIPEKFARFAACKGMWGFIKSMGPAMSSYVQIQRETGVRRIPHATSDLSLSTSSDSSSQAGSQSDRKPNKLMRTARRALVATVVTLVLIRRSNRATGSNPN